MTKELTNIITDVMQQLTKDLAEPIGNAVGMAVSKAYNQGVYDGSIMQKEQTIEKACEWLSNLPLEDMTYKYNDFDSSEDWYKFIEDFRKAMEEEK